MRSGGKALETVYVDILIITNFLIDYFILLLSNRLSGAGKKRIRIVAAAFVASLFSLLIFAPELSLFVEILINTISSLAIVFIAFGFKNIKRFLKLTLIFYASNALIAGGSMLAWSIFNLNGIIVRNGAVFYNISATFLVVTIAIVYILTVIISKIISRRMKNKEYGITLFFEGKKVRLEGFVDSGNMLRDAFSNTPVIICDYQKVKPLFNKKLDTVFVKEKFEMGFYEDILKSGYSDRFRVIPFETIDSGGILAAIIIDKAVLHTAREDQKIEKIIMAVTHKKIAGGEFDVLLSPELISF